MKRFKIGLCLVLSLVLAVGVLLPVFAEDDAAEPVSTEIGDVFSAELFSNAAVNDFLQLYPAFCFALEESLSYATQQPIVIHEQTDNSMNTTIDAVLAVYSNGEQGTNSFEEVLNTFGIKIYPRTLAAGLSQYPAAANALRSRGNRWDAFSDSEGKLDVVFDWGLDAIADPAARYEAFVNVIAALINAARPLFNTVLGTSPAVFMFSGSNGGNLYTAEVTDGKLTLHMAGSSISGISSPLDLTGLRATDMQGEVRIEPMNIYQSVIVPIYRSLGIGTVFAYSFPAVIPVDSAIATAHAVYDPLYALMNKVQTDPDVCRALIAFYHSEGFVSLVDQIGEGSENAFTVRYTVNDLELSGGSGIVSWSWMTDLFKNIVLDSLNYNYSGQNISAYLDVGNYQQTISAQLPSLTFTEPEQPTDPVTPTEPEQPTEPATEQPTEPATEPGEDQTNPLLEFLARISDFFRRIIEWFKNLFGIS